MLWTPDGIGADATARRACAYWPATRAACAASTVWRQALRGGTALQEYAPFVLRPESIVQRPPPLAWLVESRWHREAEGRRKVRHGRLRGLRLPPPFG